MSVKSELSEDIIERISKVPTFKQLIATISSAIVLIGSVSGAIYLTSQDRLKTCETRILQNEIKRATISEILKRIEQKLDTTIDYQKKREKEVEEKLKDFDIRLRELEFKTRRGRL